MSMTEKNGKIIKNRNASPSAYGWDFQVGAGIKLMLDYVTEFTAIKMEGKNDDIEITLPKGKIYAQAKSVIKMDDQSSATSKLKEALETLAEDVEKDNNTIRLIYITNILNPFSTSEGTSPYYNSYNTSYDYSILRTEDQERIKRMVGDNFPTDQLQVHVIRFFGEGKNKFDAIKENIRAFTRRVFDDISYSDLLFDKWCTQFFANAADMPQKEKSFTLSKKEALYPVIVLAIDKPIPFNEFEKVCDYDDYDGVVEKFRDLINQRSCEYEFSSSLLGEYFSQKCNLHTCEESARFKYEYTRTHWKEYESYFSEIKDDYERQAVTKLTILTIIMHSGKLRKIKEVTNL